MAPVVRAFENDDAFRAITVVSAQHRHMLDQVLRLFGIKASADLNIMQEGQSLFDVTSHVLKRFDPVLDRFKPDLVLVHGDTTTTLAGALAAYYKKIPVGHVEAGLRTYDNYKPFPEEANRRLTDAITTLHFAPTHKSQANLLQENLPPRGIFVTGNTVIDALLDVAKRPPVLRCLPLKTLVPKLAREKKGIILMTAHRRENFGAPFASICRAVLEVARRFRETHWIYPVHPNPRVYGPAHRMLADEPNVHLMPPLDYADLVAVMKMSRLVVTDSGGLQEEAPSLGKPVLVLRDVTERPEAVKAGTVRIVGTDKRKIINGVSMLLRDTRAYRRMANAVNPYGDGRAARRIVQAVAWYFGFGKKRPAEFGGRL